MKKPFLGLRSRVRRGVLCCGLILGLGILGNAHAQHGIFDIPIPKVTGDVITADEFKSILNAIQNIFRASRQDCADPGQVAQGFDENLDLICVNAQSYNCTGAAPSHATICDGDDQGLGSDTPITLVSGCGTPKCEYACNNPYIKYGSSCCLPDCSGKVCGDDGCGGSCGSCGANQSCSGGACVDNCNDTCESLGYECGTQTICGSSTSCGSCDPQDCDSQDTDCRNYHDVMQTCSGGTCQASSCTSYMDAPAGTECGSNGTCDGNGNCSECVPDNSCAQDICTNETCTDSCGNEYSGVIIPSNACAAETCVGETCTQCGTIYQGTKTTGECDPCDGVTCGDYCSGSTRYYNGSCSGGDCSYSSESCGFGCSGDYCAGDPCSGVDCDDGNPCTSDSCSGGTCSHSPVSDGTTCGTKDCDYLDNYYISPSNSVLGTSYCKFDNYSDKTRTCTDGFCTNPSCGSPSTSTLTPSAGTCLYIAGCSFSGASVDGWNYNGADCGDYSCGTDKYQIDGTQAADSTSYCRFYDYQVIDKACNDGHCSTPSCPSPSVTTIETAGLCWEIDDCNGVSQTKVKSADGTSCGSGRVCQNGSCVTPTKTCGGYLPPSCSARDSSTYTSTSTYSWAYSTSNTTRPCEYGLPSSSTRTANCPSLTTGQTRSGPDTYTQTSSWSFYGYGCSVIWSPTKTNTYGAGSACNFMCTSGYHYELGTCIENQPETYSWVRDRCGTCGVLAQKPLYVAYGTSDLADLLAAEDTCVGEQRCSVWCKRDSDGAVVSDSYCDAGTKPSYFRSCTYPCTVPDPPTYYWQTTYGSCQCCDGSSNCGDCTYIGGTPWNPYAYYCTGYKRRISYVCKENDNGVITTVANSYCGTLPSYWTSCSYTGLMWDSRECGDVIQE